jgi:hypothetical protein
MFAASIACFIIQNACCSSWGWANIGLLSGQDSPESDYRRAFLKRVTKNLQ